ncbi:MAG TPA: hypothetical protein VK942_16435 [Actinomycetes bacterium]|nr:hypothetical protein [Actinomycetes bacterium]
MTTRRGPVERAARRAVKNLGELQGMQQTLAEAAYKVARALDERDGKPDMATAACLRELRTTLDSLEHRGDSDSGEGFVASLLAPVGDAPDRPADPRRRAGAVRGGAGDAPDAVAATRRGRGVGAGP